MNVKNILRNPAYVVVAFFTGISNQVNADNWTITPFVGVGFEYDDNRLLEIGQVESVTGHSVRSSIKLKNLGEISGTEIDARFQFTDYSEEIVSGSDTTDKEVIRLNSFSKTELSTFRVSGNYVRDTTLATSDATLTDTEIDEVDDADEGLRSIKVRRNRLRIRPSWEYKINERSRFNSSYELNNLFYVDEESTGLVGSRRHSLDIGYLYSLSPKSSYKVNAGVSEFEPDAGEKQQTVELRLGYAAKIGPRFKTEAELGYQETEVSGETADGLIARFAVFKDVSDVSRYSLIITRNLSASGVGRLVQRDQARFRFRKDVSESAQIFLLVTSFRNEELGGSVSNIDRKFTSIEPKFKWRLTRNSRLDVSYRHRVQKRETLTEDAESNTLVLTYGYTMD